jgi:hypothetical protein
MLRYRSIQGAIGSRMSFSKPLALTKTPATKKRGRIFQNFHEMDKKFIALLSWFPFFCPSLKKIAGEAGRADAEYCTN